MLEFNNPDEAKAYVLQNRNAEAVWAYAGIRSSPITFRGILLTMGFEVAKRRGLLAEYRAVILDTMIPTGVPWND